MIGLGSGGVSEYLPMERWAGVGAEMNRDEWLQGGKLGSDGFSCTSNWCPVVMSENYPPT